MTSRSSIKTPPSKGPATSKTASDDGSPEGERIAKVIARAGVCSRREAEKLVEDGHVTVNGKVLDSPAFNVTGREKITVNGFPLPDAEPVRLWRYHKPAGLVTTARDPQERPTVFENLPEGMPRVVSVGRLDLNTEGLLLLTNDGELARLLELPSTGWSRRYRARAYGSVTQEQLNGLKNGIEVEGVRYGSIDAILDKVQGSNVWITLSLKEGKNREVKQVLSALGLRVNRLIRLSYGPFQMGDLEPGEVAVVPARVLIDQLGNHADAFRDRLPDGRSGAAVKAPVAAAPAKPAVAATKKAAWPEPRETAGQKGRRPDGPRTLHAQEHKRGHFHDGPGKPEGYRKTTGAPRRSTGLPPRASAEPVKPLAEEPARHTERNTHTIRQADAYKKPRPAPRRSDGPAIGAKGQDPYRKADGGPRTSTGGPRRSDGFKSHDGAPRKSEGFKKPEGARRSDGFKSHDGAPRKSEGFKKPEAARRSDGFKSHDGPPRKSEGFKKPEGARRSDGFKSHDGAPRKSEGFKKPSDPLKSRGFKSQEGTGKSRGLKSHESVNKPGGKPAGKPAGKPSGKFFGKPDGKPGGKPGTSGRPGSSGSSAASSSSKTGKNANRGWRP